MENLDFGNIAIATAIVGVLNLAIVVLIKTETILKAVERIKGVVRLDYKGRAKRSDDEIRISKKHAQVARERVRHSFITMELWNCRWTWNWSEDLEPINIKGYCLGNTGKNFLDRTEVFECNHPVEPYYFLPNEDDEDAKKSTMRQLAIWCSNPSEQPKDQLLVTNVHQRTRKVFEVFKTVVDEKNSFEAFNAIISKPILSERDLMIATEIKKLRLQFWR